MVYVIVGVRMRVGRNGLCFRYLQALGRRKVSTALLVITADAVTVLCVQFRFRFGTAVISVIVIVLYLRKHVYNRRKRAFGAGFFVYGV